MQDRAGTVAVFAVALFASGQVAAQDLAVERGRAFADVNCARCHAIGRAGDSPLVKAPPLRELHLRYPIEHLAEALGEGIRTAHRTMPEFELNQRQIEDLIAYLKALQR